MVVTIRLRIILLSYTVTIGVIIMICSIQDENSDIDQRTKNAPVVTTDDRANQGFHDIMTSFTKANVDRSFSALKKDNVQEASNNFSVPGQMIEILLDVSDTSSLALDDDNATHVRINIDMQTSKTSAIPSERLVMDITYQPLPRYSSMTVFKLKHETPCAQGTDCSRNAIVHRFSTQPIVNHKKLGPFWISWNDEYMQVGLGTQPEKLVFFASERRLNKPLQQSQTFSTLKIKSSEKSEWKLFKGGAPVGRKKHCQEQRVSQFSDSADFLTFGNENNIKKRHSTNLSSVPVKFDIRRVKHFSFSVQAKFSAAVILRHKNNATLTINLATEDYELNTISTIWNNDGMEECKPTPALLSAVEPRTFWVRWFADKLEIQEGCAPEHYFIMLAADLSLSPLEKLELASVGYASWWIHSTDDTISDAELMSYY